MAASPRRLHLHFFFSCHQTRPSPQIQSPYYIYAFLYTIHILIPIATEAPPDIFAVDRPATSLSTPVADSVVLARYNADDALATSSAHLCCSPHPPWRRALLNKHGRPPVRRLGLGGLVGLCQSAWHAAVLLWKYRLSLSQTQLFRPRHGRKGRPYRRPSWPGTFPLSLLAFSAETMSLFSRQAQLGARARMNVQVAVSIEAPTVVTTFLPNGAPSLARLAPP